MAAVQQNTNTLSLLFIYLLIIAYLFVFIIILTTFFCFYLKIGIRQAFLPKLIRRINFKNLMRKCPSQNKKVN